VAQEMVRTPQEGQDLRSESVRQAHFTLVLYVFDSWRHWDWKNTRARQSPYRAPDKFISFVRKLNAYLTYLNFETECRAGNKSD